MRNVFRIGEVFEFIRNGKNIKQSGSQGYPITRIETIANGTINLERLGYADIFDLHQYQDYLLKKNDILMSHINSEKHLGKVAIFKGDEKIIHGMNVLCLRPQKNIIDSKYAFYFFCSNYFKAQIPNITKKSVNQASFTVTSLKKLSIPVPTMEIQKKVVEVLDKAQLLIDMRKKQIELLDELVHSIFIDMFGDPVSNPKGWIKKTVGEVSKGKAINGFFAKTEDYNESGNTEVIWISDFINKFFCDVEGLKRIQSTEKEIRKYGVNYGDILFCRSSLNVEGIGKAACVPKVNKNVIFECHIIKISLDTSIVEPVFFKVMTDSQLFRKQIMKNSKTATMTTINQEGILKCELLVPPLKLQQEFTNIITHLHNEKNLLKESFNLLQTNFNSIMQKAFRGELFT